MKKILATILLAAMALSLAACNITVNTNGNSSDSSVSSAENTEAAAETQADKKANLEGKNTYTYEDIIVAIPDDFSVDEDKSPIMAYPDSYPKKTDNIAFTKAGKDSASHYDQKTIEKSYKSIMSGFTGISRFEKGDVDGNEAIVITYGVKYDDVKMIQTQTFVFLDTKSVVITYTSVSGDYDDDFEFSIDNLTVAE